MMKHNTHRLALMGLLTALGLIIGYIEFLIPIPLGIPGVKPGFANIVIVWVQSGTMGGTDDQRYEDLSVRFLIW